MKKTAWQWILSVITILTFFLTLFLGQISQSIPHLARAQTAPAQITIPLTEAEQDWLNDHPVIRVSNEPDWAPFDFIENGKPAGYCIDYFHLLEAKLGVQFEFVTDTWANLLKRIAAQEIDIIQPLFETPARQDYLTFTQPFLSLTSAIAVRSRETEISTLKDVRNKKVAVIDGYLFHQHLNERYPFKAQILVSSPVEALEAIASGRADVYYDSLGVINYWRNKNFITNLTVIAIESRDTDNISDYSMAVRKDWEILRNILQKAINSMSENELIPLRQKWIDQSVASGIMKNQSLIWKVVLISLSIILLVVVWNYRLNRVLKKIQKTKDINEKTISALEHIVKIDSLTTLFNRRHLDFILTMEWERHCYLGSKLSLIMCDIDYFKQFNDTYGHQAGDDCLKQVALILKQESQKQECIATRYGGEEFVIVLPNMESSEAQTIANQIKVAIAQLQIPHHASEVKSIVSMSFGVATMYPNANIKPEQLIRVADQALYHSKRAGRDRVTVFDQSRR